MNEEMFQLPEQQCPVLQETYTHTQTVYEIILDGPIEEPSFYRDAFHAIRNAGESDFIRILINSEGGSMLSAIQFKNCIENCLCPVEAVIEGQALSAGGMIALCADNLIVNDYCILMAHHASFGSVGTVANIKAHVDFTTEQTERFIREVYKHYLTDSEIEDLIRNKEIWHQDEEIRNRWENVVKARQAAYEVEEESLPDELDTHVVTH